MSPAPKSSDGQGGSCRYEARTTGLGDKTQVHYTQSRRDWLKRSDHRLPRVVPRRLARTCRVEFRNVKKERSCFALDHFELAPPRASSSRSFFRFFEQNLLERRCSTIFSKARLWNERKSEEFQRISMFISWSEVKELLGQLLFFFIFSGERNLYKNI